MKCHHKAIWRSDRSNHVDNWSEQCMLYMYVIIYVTCVCYWVMMISHTTHTWPVNHTQCNSNCKCSQNHCSLLHAFKIVTVSPFITTTFLYLYFVSQQNCNYGLIRSLLHNVQLLYMNLSVVVWVCIYTSNVFTCSQRRRSNKGGRCACRVILQ